VEHLRSSAKDCADPRPGQYSHKQSFAAAARVRWQKSLFDFQNKLKIETEVELSLSVFTSSSSSAGRKKKSCIRSETEGIKITIKSQELSPKRGARDGTRTHVGMSKRSDLHNKGQESTSHQAALATGRTNLIYTIHQTIRQTRARRWSSYKMSYRNGQLCP
jgi:hypothetical protein